MESKLLIMINPLLGFLEKALNGFGFYGMCLIFIYRDQFEKEIFFEKTSKNSFPCDPKEEISISLISKGDRMCSCGFNRSRLLSESGKDAGVIFLHNCLVGVHSSAEDPMLDEAISVLLFAFFYLYKYERINQDAILLSEDFWDKFNQEVSLIKKQVVSDNTWLISLLQDIQIHRHFASKCVEMSLS